MSTNPYADVQNLIGKVNGLKLSAAEAERDQVLTDVQFWHGRLEVALAELADARTRLAEQDAADAAEMAAHRASPTTWQGDVQQLVDVVAAADEVNR